MSRLLLRFLVLAAIAPLVTACCGGGASHGSPAVLPQSVQTVAPQLPSAPAGVPQTALRGVLVSVHLPLRNSDELDTLIANQADEHSPAYRHFLTPEQFRDRYAPAAADLNAAAATLQAAGYETRVTSQTILAAASQPIVERSFGVRLQQTNARNRTLLSADRAPILSAALTKLGASVTFSRFVYHTNSKRVERTSLGQDNRYGADGPYWFTDLKEAYGYPSYRSLNGAGRTIAIVISSDILDSDLAKYFGHEELARIPTVVRRPVNGGPPPFDVNSRGFRRGEPRCAAVVRKRSGSFAHPLRHPRPLGSEHLGRLSSGRRREPRRYREFLVRPVRVVLHEGVQRRRRLHAPLAQLQQRFPPGERARASRSSLLRATTARYDCTDPSGTVLVKGVENPADDPNVTAVGGTNLVTASVAGSKQFPLRRRERLLRCARSGARRVAEPDLGIRRRRSANSSKSPGTKASSNARSDADGPGYRDAHGRLPARIAAVRPGSILRRHRDRRQLLSADRDERIRAGVRRAPRRDGAVARNAARERERLHLFARRDLRQPRLPASAGE